MFVGSIWENSFVCRCCCASIKSSPSHSGCRSRSLLWMRMARWFIFPSESLTAVWLSRRVFALRTNDRWNTFLLIMSVWQQQYRYHMTQDEVLGEVCHLVLSDTWKQSRLGSRRVFELARADTFTFNNHFYLFPLLSYRMKVNSKWVLTFSTNLRSLRLKLQLKSIFHTWS